MGAGVERGNGCGGTRRVRNCVRVMSFEDVQFSERTRKLLEVEVGRASFLVDD